MLIEGSWVDSSDAKTLDVINPATEEKIYSIPCASQEDLAAALLSSDIAWKKWRDVDAWTRSAKLRRVADILRERADEIASALTEEQGKTLPESKGEILATADQFDWYADEARRIYGRWIDGHNSSQRLLVRHQSVGPVAAFSPWNFPALLAARKIAPAIAAGCSIIVKPAEEAPRSVFAIGKACMDAGIPAGVINIVTGNPSEISETLIRSNIIRKVSLTGSVPVGQELLRLCALGVKSVSMELGGHSPVLVFADADVEKAARTCARSKFRNNGQVCISASRFFVQDKIADAFTAFFVNETQKMKLGNGADSGTDIGPLSNERRRNAAEELIRDAVSKGAVVASGGRRPTNLKKGYFLEPTVLTNVTQDMKIMTQEPFCPVAPITTFTDMEDALKKANSTEYGLAGYIFTENTKTAFLASEGLEVGMVGVNNMILATAEIPFGGVKKSGFGREGGSEGILEYTVLKYINIQL